MRKLRFLAASVVPGFVLTRRRVKAKTLEHEYNMNWDMMPEHSGTRVLYLIRHGRYDILNKDQDQQFLTKLGREQLIETGKHLAEVYKEHHNNQPPEFIVSSTMTRAIESRDLIMAQFPEDFFPKCEKTDLLRECVVTTPIQRQGKPKYEKDEYRRSAQYGIHTLEAAMLKYMHRGDHTEGEQTAIIVCHANVIRYILCRLMQVRPNAWLQFSLNHGSVTKIVIKGDGDIRVHSVGQAGFMPDPKMVTITNERLEYDLRPAEEPKQE